MTLLPLFRASLLLFSGFVTLFSHDCAEPVQVEKEANCSFKQVWGYVMRSEDAHLQGDEPITDILYFSAIVGDTGRLEKIPDRTQLSPRFLANRRLHLVISTPSNRSLIYWCLAKDIAVRDQLIEDIVKASEGYEGLQIDFEAIRPEEGPAYLSFLRLLRTALPKRLIFSVALPARTNEKPDAFNYEQVAQIADKVVIMAYDEHWRSGKAGPIASLAWCQRVMQFAKQKIPSNKLVMGLPLYGRVWQRQEVACSLKYTQLLALWKKQHSPLKRMEDGTPYFSYALSVDADVYFEDKHSLFRKLALYQANEVKAVAFWRIGQEPAALWKELKAERSGSK